MEIKERIRVTKDMVQAFADISGDCNPIHLSAEAASLTRFRKPIAHGILLASFFSKIIASKFPGKGSIYVSQSLEFLAPCFVDSEVEVTIRLLEQVRQMYTLDTIIYDTDGKVLVRGVAKIFNPELNG
jgi:acyl dehydratase